MLFNLKKKISHLCKMELIFNFYAKAVADYILNFNLKHFQLYIFRFYDRFDLYRDPKL